MMSQVDFVMWLRKQIVYNFKESSGLTRSSSLYIINIDNKYNIDLHLFTNYVNILAWDRDTNLIYNERVYLADYNRYDVNPLFSVLHKGEKDAKI